MTDITIIVEARSVSVEYSDATRKVDATIEGVSVLGIVENIGLEKIIQYCGESDILSLITFEHIEKYIKAQGYSVVKDVD